MIAITPKQKKLELSVHKTDNSQTQTNLKVDVANVFSLKQKNV